MVIDWEIEYVGRDDFQKKIRGMRIEIAEIEAVLSSYPSVQQCAVVLKDNSNLTTTTTSDETESKYLIGYYVAESKLDEQEIFAYMQKKLPIYMIPNVLVHLNKLPLTLNGKLDQKLLPEPKFTNRSNYVAPRNEIETSACAIFASILGLSSDKVGISDNFFRMGGNSILAIRIISKLNEHFQAHLKISDIFVHQTIETLLPKIVQTKDKYQAIMKLNNAEGGSKTNMFMVHSGISGCEVYIPLANRLSNHFTCYGVDSYNLYCTPKIGKLRELALYYLNFIEKIMEESNQTDYYLLGWSLGGQIALEMASILEQKGVVNIKVYLLDTLLTDDTLLEIQSRVDHEEMISAYRNYFSSRGYEVAYMEKVIKNIDIEKNIANEKMTTSCILAHTKLVLFIAMLEDPCIKFHQSSEIHNYVSTLNANNVDRLLAADGGSNLEIIRLKNVHHFNILSEEDAIISVII